MDREQLSVNRLFDRCTQIACKSNEGLREAAAEQVPHPAHQEPSKRDRAWHYAGIRDGTSGWEIHYSGATLAPASEMQV